MIAVAKNLEVWIQVNCPKCGRRACDVQAKAHVIIRVRCQREQCRIVFTAELVPPE